MANTPRARLTVSQDAAPPSNGSKRCVIVAPVPSNADGALRWYTNSKAVLDRHGYAQGVDLAAIHVEETGEQFGFIGLPIAVPGVVGQINTNGNTGESVVSIALGSDGALDECEIVVTVLTGGVVGTSPIRLSVSLDGGRSSKVVRFSGTSYTIPYVGLTLSATADTLIEGDVILTAKSTAPQCDSAGIALARAAMAAQQEQFGSVIVASDSPNLAFAQAVTAQMNAYETESQRFAFARVSTGDRHDASLSTLTGNIVFSDSTDTATRSSGSWISDGFRVGQTVTVNSATNDGEYLVTDVTSTVLTFESGDIAAAETIAAATVTITATESIADHEERIAATYAAIDGEPRVSLGLGRGYKLSPTLQASLRRPVQWAANVRQYQHDVHIPTWQTAQNSLSGWSLNDSDNQLAEYDDRVHGGNASLNKFTSFRTWSNKQGVFIALDLTREADGLLLTHVSNQATVDKACAICQAATENEVGQRPEVNADGTGTTAALSAIEQRVNSQISKVMLVNAGEGVPVSACAWFADPASVLSGAEPELLGTLDILLNGLIHSVRTTARVR